MYQRILVPYDGSVPSGRGLDEAVKLAALTGARLRVVHVIDELSHNTGFEPAAIYVSEVLEGMRRHGMAMLTEARTRAVKGGVIVETQLLESEGRPIVERLLEQARSWPADLIVIGSHGRRGAARMFMGSDAEHILRLSPVPVMIVRQATPAT